MISGEPVAVDIIVKPDNRCKVLALVFLAMVFSSGCSIRKMAISEMSGMMKDSRVVFEKETDLTLAEDGLGANLKLLEAMAIHDPENDELNMFLAEGYATYTLAFVEDKYEQYEGNDEDLAEYHKDRAVTLYMRSRDYAAKVLKHQMKKLPEQMTKDELESALKKIDKDHIQELFWYAFSWGGAINLQRDNIAALANLFKIEAMMTRVKQLDETYYYGGAWLFEGVYYGGRSRMLGGNPERAEAAFKKVFEISQKKLLIAPYFYARTVCIQKQDVDCFEQNLQYVIDTPADVHEQVLANTVARQKARRLLERKESYFLLEEFNLDSLDGESEETDNAGR